MLGRGTHSKAAAVEIYQTWCSFLQPLGRVDVQPDPAGVGGNALLFQPNTPVAAAEGKPQKGIGNSQKGGVHGRIQFG